MTSIIYSKRILIISAMRLLYSKGFGDRYKQIAMLIPNHSTVLEVCCGDCYLYKHYLSQKNIKYLGLDINPHFISSALKDGINILHHDQLSNKPIPEAQYIIIQASLYHFLPNEDIIFDKFCDQPKMN